MLSVSEIWCALEERHLFGHSTGEMSIGERKDCMDIIWQHPAAAV
jgi:hypothetical protein